MHRPFAYAALLILFLAVGCTDEGGGTDMIDAGPDASVDPLPTCSDGIDNGTETDVDCGGPCDPCGHLMACANDVDCASGKCHSLLCVEGPTAGFTLDKTAGEAPLQVAVASNGATAGDAAITTVEYEFGAGAGFGTATEGVLPSAGSYVVTQRVTDANGYTATATVGVEVSPAPTCFDETENGTETDVDCGGPCDPCEHLMACEIDGDCVSDKCHSQVCVEGPTAGFTLDKTSGEAQLRVAVASNGATAGDAAITTVEYEFGAGAGFGTATAGSFRNAGSYVVTQRVTDANGYTATSTVGVDVSMYGGTYFSGTDRAQHVVVGPTGTTITIESTGTQGVRSTRSIAPGSGVFYFEASILEPINENTVGIATADAPLNQRAGENSQSFGVDTGGSISSEGAWRRSLDASTLTTGFVVDYRGSNPTVHVISQDWGVDEVVYSETLEAITTPVYIYAAGIRRTKEEQLRINAGNDTTNDPFVYDPAALLVAGGLEDVAAELTLGFGGTRSFAFHDAPVVTPSVASASIALGDEITLTATADDTEDGDLSAMILWEDLSAGVAISPISHVGSSFTFTPEVLGIHPIRLTVVDSGGKRARVVVDVNVAGTLALETSVRLHVEPGLTGEMLVDADGYRTQYVNAEKMAIRANQGLYGGFWYFEGTRLGPPVNQGIGLVIGGTDLDPYPFNTTPPSCSVNVLSSTWRDLMYKSGLDAQNTSTYGFAVDYRGRYPIVYVIGRHIPWGETEPVPTVADVIHMVDATVPVYPMLYGETTGSGTWDIYINFGQAPFVYDPATVIGTDLPGTDVSELLLCWGTQNAACSN